MDTETETGAREHTRHCAANPSLSAKLQTKFELLVPSLTRREAWLVPLPQS